MRTPGPRTVDARHSGSALVHLSSPALNDTSTPGTLQLGQVKTFYIETFGCQMNVHDSEKVIGTLLNQGYTQVDTPEQAELVFYNTCSIRDKAEQKVFSRLQQFKKEHGKGKTFA